MKALSMAIWSPGRPEKFPPPPRKYSRSSTGSRSRSSRSGLVFYIRSRRNAAGMIEAADQEPYSPKVTCIGQVRARKSAARRRRCWFLGKFLSRFYRRRRVLCKWVVLCRSGYCKKVDAVEDCLTKMEVLGGKLEDVVEITVAENGRGFDGDVDGDSCCSPPRNGLMLTRCSRSAPYRASSLGERFWRENGDEMLQNPVCEDVAAESAGIRQECSENPRNNVSVRDNLEGMVVQPLMLTRCKSEPAARTREMFDQE